MGSSDTPCPIVGCTPPARPGTTSGEARHHVTRDGTPTSCVILGIAGDERTQGFGAALRRAGLPAPHVLDYRRFVQAPSDLPALFPADTGMLRIESPGGDPELRRALIRFGQPDEAIDEPAGEPTQLRSAHRFQRGFEAAIRLACGLAPDGVVPTHDPDAVALFYDKRACHAFMARHGFPVPRALPPTEGFDRLLDRMRAAGMARVFVKPRYGSGAAGIAALAVSRSGIVATSSAELVRVAGGAVLHHTHRLRRYAGADAAALVDAILAQDAHVEQWVPKAAIGGRAFDLRVLVVAGEVAHIVARTGLGPITNLDLGARRTEAAPIRAMMTPSSWDKLLDDCRRFARLFPATFHVGFDLAMAVGCKRHVFFEANAFGDLLRRVRHEGLDPYGLQVARFPAWAASRLPALHAA